jgi:hypothetical protein
MLIVHPSRMRSLRVSVEGMAAREIGAPAGGSRVCARDERDSGALGGKLRTHSKALRLLPTAKAPCRLRGFHVVSVTGKLV